MCGLLIPLSASAGLDDYDGDFNSCTCESDTPPTLSGSWNGCLACVFVAQTNLYNELTTALAESGINPDTDAETTFTEGGSSFTVTLADSSVEGYDRSAMVSGASDNGLCLRIEYAKNSTDSTRVKFFMMMDTSNCPSGGDEGADSQSHALAMKVDLKYTDVNVQEGQFVTLGQEDGGGPGEFDLATTDNFFGMNLSVDETGGTALTQGYVSYHSNNRPWKFYLEGIDDQTLFFAELSGGSFSDTTTDGSDFENDGCFNDATQVATDDATCTDAGYAYDSSVVLRTVATEASKTFPTWTSSTAIPATLSESTFDLITLFPDAS